MSDRLAVMRQGEIEQVGPPQDVYDEPQTTYVADFLGLANLLPAAIPESGVIEVLGSVLAVPTGDLRGACTVFARPERLKLVPPGAGFVDGRVTDIAFVGSTTHVRTVAADQEIQIVVSNDGATWIPAPGTPVGIEVSADSIRLLER